MGAPRALKSWMCLKVFSTWSSPRMMWVTPWVMSSSTLARWKTGEPSERTMTKSCVSFACLRMRPLTRSSYSMTPSFGIRKMTHSPWPPLFSL